MIRWYAVESAPDYLGLETYFIDRKTVIVYIPCKGGQWVTHSIVKDDDSKYIAYALGRISKEEAARSLKEVMNGDGLMPPTEEINTILTLINKS